MIEQSPFDFMRDVLALVAVLRELFVGAGAPRWLLTLLWSLTSDESVLPALRLLFVFLLVFWLPLSM